MPKAWCVKTVDRLFKSVGKASDFSAVSTSRPKYLTSQVFLTGGFWTVYKQVGGLFTQLPGDGSNLFWAGFYTISTNPINKTNLNKGFLVS